MTVAEPAAYTATIPSPRAPLPDERVGGGRVAAGGPGRGRRRGIRWLALGALGAAFVVTCAGVGLPTDRVVLLGWVLAGLVLYAAADGPRRVVRLLVDWLPLVAVLLAYDASRGLADGFGATVHVAELATADRWLAGGGLPTVVLQQSWQADWWKAVASLVYASHFVVTPLVLGVLWVRNRERWTTFARLVVGLSAAGLATYVLYPAAPPWLAAKEGVIEPVRRLSGAGWEVLGLPRAGALLADSQGQVNQVAAVPSLHTAFAVLVCLVLLPVARRSWQRLVLLGYGPAMALVLVWSGEHYVVDTLLGAAYAGAVVAVAARWRARRRRTAPARATAGDGAVRASTVDA
ncbi:phosphatase PAP2 family protein [Blastococcus tunisiensis]|uniref:PAP2 superfamily protein n=1 Tax=Blastococcus tunisiensis TaxID=1798228 RepID=A0A1I2MJB8_9ACTN|nr:phosphatase PAP2 family protein [Blastococcus sp. DSM 46838]SFF89211.1 PAP2 superfamily protein [Blastococcus sp. DSM 46838]